MKIRKTMATANCYKPFYCYIMKYVILVFLIILLANLAIQKYIENVIRRISDRSKRLKPIDRDIFLLKLKQRNIELYSSVEEWNLIPMMDKAAYIKYQDMLYDKRVPKIESSIHTADNSWTEKKEKSSDLSVVGFLSYFYKLHVGYSLAQVTGGSSGLYLYKYVTLRELYKGLYGFMMCWSNMGWSPGKRILLYYFHGANSVKILEKLNYLSGDSFRVVVPKVDNEGDITLASFYQFIDTINTYKPFVIVSFPSIIFRVSQLMYEHDIKLQHMPSAMDLSADFMFSCQQDFVRSMFSGCDIRLSYGTIEFGQIAQQIPGRMFDYRVFDELCHVENKDEFLVVTSFLYDTQPIVRYVTDDVGTVVEESGQTIIQNLLGKMNKRYNLVSIDYALRHFDTSCKIINLRIDDTNQIVFVYIISNQRCSALEKYLSGLFKGFRITTVICRPSNCPTNDRFDRKNTVVMNEYRYV